MLEWQTQCRNFVAPLLRAGVVVANTDVIKRVQDAEANAKAIVDNANKVKIDKVERAKQKAAKIIEETNSKINELRASTLEANAKEFEKEREKALSDIKKQAEKLRKTKATRKIIEAVQKESIKKILGE